MNERDINLSIYYPRGILNCKDLSELARLHLLEHLIVVNISEIFNLDRIGNIKGGTNLNYFIIKFRIGESKVDEVVNYFNNFISNLKKIKKRTFFVEKDRLKEEEYLTRKDYFYQLKEVIFSRIFDSKLFDYSMKKFLKILDEMRLSEIIDFTHLFNEKHFFIFAFRNKPYLVKEVEDNLDLDLDMPSFYKGEIIKIKKGFLPQHFILFNYFDHDFEKMFFYDLLVKQKSFLDFLRKIVFEKGFSYNYRIERYFYLLNKFISLITISTTNLKKVKVEFKRFLDHNREIENFVALKEREIKRSEEKFYHKFKPAIVSYYLKNRKLPHKLEVIKRLKELSYGNFKHFISNLQNIIFELS
nr:hypothetical protein [Patescibacteria group bacterium]